jgi:hypothetical protein
MSQIAQISRVDFWRQRAPAFHVGDETFWRAVRRFPCSNEEAAAIDSRMRREGYFRLRHDFGLDLAAMAGLVGGLVADGFPPVFAFVYDEFWALFRGLDPIYGNILGHYGLLPDFWVWHVDASQGDAGWKPHRDKGRESLRADGTPLSLSTWIPLTDATPLNSCMYVVPADRDPTYGTEREKEWLFDLPSIRALPAAPGDVMMWTQALMHWGSRGSREETRPRISVSLEVQATEVPPFNRPFLPSGQLVPFEMRLPLIGKQMLQYRQMYRLDPSIEQLALQLASALERA